MAKARSLVDVNILVALADPDHQHHRPAMNWFVEHGSHDWGTCAFTESGFVRVMTHPKVGGITIEESKEILERLEHLPGFRFWPMTVRWHELIAPFEERVVGHQQITDAYLLGLAIQENGVLVTLDRGLRYLAGREHAKHLLVLV